jgi:hypothetical protein
MDASQVAQLVEIFAKKQALTGFEYMTYMKLCELLETICRRIDKTLRAEDEPDDASS